MYACMYVRMYVCMYVSFFTDADVHTKPPWFYVFLIVFFKKKHFSLISQFFYLFVNRMTSIINNNVSYSIQRFFIFIMVVIKSLNF